MPARCLLFWRNFHLELDRRLKLGCNLYLSEGLHFNFHVSVTCIRELVKSVTVVKIPSSRLHVLESTLIA
jgi:hypothetical protein